MNEERGFSLETSEILQYQQNKYPYFFIDRVDNVIPGKSARGYKNLTYNEWFFPGHFEGHPNMPGMLQMEALVQMLVMTIVTLPNLKGKMTNFLSLDNAKFKKRILPGDRLEIEAELHSFRRGIARGSGIGYVKGEIACSADFVICIPDILEQYLPKKGDKQ